MAKDEEKKEYARHKYRTSGEGKGEKENYCCECNGKYCCSEE